MSFLLSIDNQYLTVLLCWGNLPRPRAMILPLYSKLIVQFQELVEIIDIGVLSGGGQRGLVHSLKLVKV